jgi:hypothetical protein
MVYDTARRASLMYGGSWSLEDTWYWDGIVWRFMNVGGPPGREFHAMAHDSQRGVTVLFGGVGPPSQVAKESGLGDTWEWDGVNWAVREVPGPPARSEHAMTFDSARSVVVLFAGSAAPVRWQPLNDTWEWNGTEWTEKGTGPSPRSSHAMAYDESRGVTVLFGGRGYTENYELQYFGDTWEWDGTTWSLKATEGPPPRAYHALGYDESRGVIVLYGGGGPSYKAFGDTWEWDGTSWVRQASMGNARAYHAMVYDAVRETMLACGGIGNYSGETSIAELQPGFPIYDAERDCDVDLFDLAEWETCVGDWPLFLGCIRFDTDGNGVVESADFAGLLMEFSGPR